jgi:hypothetical protein
VAGSGRVQWQWQLAGGSGRKKTLFAGFGFLNAKSEVNLGVLLVILGYFNSNFEYFSHFSNQKTTLFHQKTAFFPF